MQNPAFHDKNSHYYTREKAWLVPMINQGPNVVLDLGCGSGRLGVRLLKDGRAARMIGVEIFQSAADEAAKAYEKVYVGDVEEMPLDYADYFDYVVCGDVLEHLKDPYKTVARLRTMLKPGGSILVCVPNVRNFRVLGQLIFQGDFRYVSAGILDQTHLRFFTRSSCKRMLEEAGFEVYVDQALVQGTKKELFNAATFGLASGFLANQVFCCGRKPNSRN